MYHITGSKKPNAANIKKLLLSKIKELYADVSLLRPTKGGLNGDPKRVQICKCNEFK